MSLSPEDKKRIGGSDVSAIVGVSPYAGPLSVYMRIVEGVEREDTPPLSRGRRLEPVVLDWYAETTGKAVDRGPNGDGVRWPTGIPHIRASLDAVAWELGTWGRRDWNVVVDAKTAGASEAHRYGEEGTDQIPTEYLCQFQFYMGLTGRHQTDVPALVAGDFRLYHVEYDPDVYGALRESVERFWVDHVLARRPPDPTALPNDTEAIRRRFGRHEGEGPLEFAALPPEAQATLEEYLRAYREEIAAAERLSLWEARAKLTVGSAPGVTGLPAELGYGRLDWRAQKGKPQWKAVAESLAKKFGVNEAQLSALVAENTGEGARPFIPRPLKGKK